MRKSLLGSHVYAYGQLGPRLQAAYEGMYRSICDLEPIRARDYPGVEPVELSRTLACIDMDHPELFWMDGYQSVREMLKLCQILVQDDELLERYKGEWDECGVDINRNGKIDATDRLFAVSGDLFDQIPWGKWAIFTELKPPLLTTKGKIRRTQADIDAWMAAFLAGAPADGDDYELLRYAFEYLCSNTTYNLKAKKSQDIRSVFVRGESVCKGYSESLQYMLLTLGVPCFTINGVAVDPASGTKTGHAWNYVKVDGEWNIVDVTFGDVNMQKNPRATAFPEWLRSSFVNYRYMCITGHDRRPSDLVPLPEPSRTSDYFLREGNVIGELRMRDFVRPLFRLYSGKERFVVLKTEVRARDAVEWLKRCGYTMRCLYEGFGGDADGLLATTPEEGNERIAQGEKALQDRYGKDVPKVSMSIIDPLARLVVVYADEQVGADA